MFSTLISRFGNAVFLGGWGGGGISFCAYDYQMNRSDSRIRDSVRQMRTTD